MGRKYIGHHICIITKNGDASKSHNGVIVIAHGSQRVGKTFALEGGAVWFYCPDGSTLLEHKYTFFRTRIVTHVVEKLSGPGDKTCPDYDLSKTTTYHGSAQHALVGKTQIIKDLKDNPDEAEAKGYSDYDHLEKLVKAGDISYDILSIRNRWFSQGTTFSNVMKMLKKAGYGYGEVHCYFCRSKPVNPPVWDVEFRKHV